MQDGADVVQERITEVGRIRSDNRNLEAKASHRQRQERDSQGAGMSVGRSEQEHDRAVRPTTKQRMNLVAPSGAFPGLWKTPGRISILVIPGSLGRGIQDHVYSMNDLHSCQLQHHPQKEKPQGPEPQRLTTFPILDAA